MKEKYNLGLVSVSFRQHSPKEILEAAQTAELSCIEWGSDVHAPCNDTARLAKIAKLQKEYGIVCSSYGTYFRLNETPLEELCKYIGAAKILGTDTLRLWCGRKSGKDMTSEERQAFLEVCKKAAAIAEESCVTLCMECHRGTFTESPDDAVWLMRSVGSPHFRMYWQPFQWQSTTYKLNNGMRLTSYGEYDADGKKVMNQHALPWQKQNFNAGVWLESSDGKFGIGIEVHRGRNNPF